MVFKKIYIFLFAFIFCFAPFVYANLEDNEQIDTTTLKDEIVETSTNTTDCPEINSRSAIVIDRTTKKILYGKNEYDVRKMASTTKIMTAIIVIENSNLYDTVTVSKKAANTGGSCLGIDEGDKISVLDLLYGLLLKSGNDTAVALAEYVGGSLEGFADLMNKKAGQLNLTNTHFVTPHGLDNDNHYTTAYELALLSDYALCNETFYNIVGTKSYAVTINGTPVEISNTNELLGNLNGVYGVKTGFTNGANRCLVTSCKRDDLDVVCVVLGSDTKKFRSQDSIKLIEYVFSNYKMFNLKDFVFNEFNDWKINHLSNFKVVKGIPNVLDFRLKDFDYTLYPVRKEYFNDVHVSFDCNYVFDAPLPAGTKVGTLGVIVDNSSVLNFDIVNSINVDKKFFFYYFSEILSKFFKYLTIHF